MDLLKIILSIITTLGGIEGIKWGVKAWRYRNTDQRKEEATTSQMELGYQQKKTDWQEERIRQLHGSLEEIYERLETEKTEKIEWIVRCHKCEMALKEAEIRKCNKRGCLQREPSSDF